MTMQKSTIKRAIYTGGEGETKTKRRVIAINDGVGGAQFVTFIDCLENGKDNGDVQERTITLKSFADWAVEEFIPWIKKPASEFLKVEFDDKQIMELATDLARLTRELGVQKENKKAAVSQLTAEIDATESKITSVSTKITDRGEFKNVRCEWTFDDPKPQWKTLRRLDTGVEVKTSMMSEADCQQTLFEEDETESKDEKKSAA